MTGRSKTALDIAKHQFDNEPVSTYIAIDLKSFYASVECQERNVDALRTNLVVADTSRTEKTICLAVSPSLKAYGIPGRARLFEVLERVKEVNRERLAHAPGHVFTGESVDAEELKQDPSLKLSFIAATPRMAEYMKVSSRIYQIYLRYIAPEDIHVYSVDEVFMDVTHYLDTYGMTAHELARQMIRDVYRETKITATAGIGTNLYLCKIAMDIWAKHVPADEDGVRIAELDEMSYRRHLWTHTPITDFWRVGGGTARKLAEHGIYTMGDIARCSVGDARDYHNEELLYGLLGINAELLIDHAWGYEPCTIDLIKQYRPKENSIGSGQVLSSGYPFDKAKIIVREMTDQLVLDLVKKGLVTDQVVLMIAYDIDNLKDPALKKKYRDRMETDRYGRTVPKSAHGSRNLDQPTSSTQRIMEASMELFDRIADPELLVRRIFLTFNHTISEEAAEQKEAEHYEQMDLFTDYQAVEKERQSQELSLKKERAIQKATLEIREKFGKNALLKGTSLQEGATIRERNAQIGGHKA